MQAPLVRRIYFFLCALVSEYILPDHGGRLIVQDNPSGDRGSGRREADGLGTLVLVELCRELHDIVYHLG